MTFLFSDLAFIACLVSLTITARNVGWPLSCFAKFRGAKKVNLRNSPDLRTIFVPERLLQKFSKNYLYHTRTLYPTYKILVTHFLSSVITSNLQELPVLFSYPFSASFSKIHALVSGHLSFSFYESCSFESPIFDLGKWPPHQKVILTFRRSKLLELLNNSRQWSVGISSIS